MTHHLQGSADGTDVVVNGPWGHRDAAPLFDGRADGLVLNYALGFQENDLRFLRGLPVRRLFLLDRAMSDLSPIYGLDGLVSLQVQSDGKYELDLALLSELKELGIDWRQVRQSIHEAPGLEDLFLLSYNEADLEPLTVIPNLTRLVMKDQPRLRSLEGVQQLPWLRTLAPLGASKLEDLTPLAQGWPLVLERFQLMGSRKVSHIDSLATCTELRFLELSNGGELESIRALGGLTKLESLHLWGSTSIADGDLSALLKMPQLRDLRLVNRRHYSPSEHAISAAIEARTE